MSLESMAFAGILFCIVVLLVGKKHSAARAVGEMPEPSPDVHELIAAGKTVAAVKAYRKETGASLIEANNVVKHYAQITRPPLN